MRTTLLAFATTAALWLALPAQARPGTPHHRSPDGAAQICDVSVVAGILAKPLNLAFPEGQDTGDLLDLVCAPHPLQPQLTIVALFHEIKDDKGADVDDRKGFVAAVVDARRGQLKGLYRETIDLNPGIRITDTSLSIDTARYELANGVRAFGVRMDIGHSPKCADVGSTDFLTLLAPEGEALRPVLKRQPLHVWMVAKWDLADSIDACSVETLNEADLSLATSPASHRGWHDLIVTARVRMRTASGGNGMQPARRKAVATLHYDGTQYPAKLGGAATKLLKP